MTAEYRTLEDDSARAYIDALQLYDAYSEALADRKKYERRMHWQTHASGYRYLVASTSLRGRRANRSLGPDSEETRKIHDAYTQAQADAISRLKSLTTQYEKITRINRAIGLGSAPSIVVDILGQLEDAGLHKKLLIIGTNAMYAYAGAAKVKFDTAVTATQDLDLLWDSRARIQLASPDPQGLLGVLKRADPTFRKLASNGYTVANAKGYQVDLIKRNEGFRGETEPYQPWANEEDFWAVKTNNMDWLLSAPRFSQVIVGVNGKMAAMHTVDPRAFVLFKYWLSEQPDRDPGKARRDLRQARAVQNLVEEWMPHWSFNDLVPFPQRVRDMSAKDPTA